MAAVKILAILSLVCIYTQATPPKTTRNTIFADEKFKGEVFEDVDVFDSISLSPRNDPPRLPTTTRPAHYNILWSIDMERLAYSGSVDIELFATQADVNEIVIHFDHMTLTDISLVQGTTNIPITHSFQREYQFLRVQLITGSLNFNANNPFNPTLYTLSITFAAEMRDDMYGIYKSWYRNSYNEPERWIATTQFQATAARYAFPCYDEPSFKATFSVTIRRPNAFTSWFCTRRESFSTPLAGYTDDHYYMTPIMSTYLLALIVAEYESLPVTSNNQLMHEVIARPGAIYAGQGQYALVTGQALLAEMNDHTDYNFYTQNVNLKMTQAAIPDFGAGAMENWGLLTYREAYLMYDEQHTNSNYKQLIAYILSHEIAHMWFGNLVTCDWWDVLWLNEGFARYYQYYLTYWVEDMGLATRFITERVHNSLLADSANNPHPLSNPGVATNAAVSAMFSAITYDKGAAIIRMTEHLLGFEVQRQGLRNYLREKEFQTALPIDLFNALERAGNEAGALTAYGPDFDFVAYYRSWTEQPGHPVLNVQVDHATGTMTIYQRRFNINTGFSTAGTNYIVPITFASASRPDFTNTKPTHIISDSITVINRGSIGDEWVLFNVQQTGFYRVNYDDYTWDLIALALRGPDRLLIHEYNRAQIVNDVFSFARAGIMSYERAFSILSFLEFETEYTPWVAAVTGFNWIRNRIVGTPLLAQVNALIARWGNTVMTQLTYYPIANEPFMRSYLRMQLAPTMCLVGAEGCLAAATAQFNALLLDGDEVPVDSRVWVYCNGLRAATSANAYDFMWTRFLQHNVYTEKIVLLSVLGCYPGAPQLQQYMQNIVTDNFVIRPQDYTTAWSSAVSSNEGNTQIAFTFIQNNLQLVSNAFGSPVTPLSYVSSRLRTEDEIVAFQAWATDNQAALGNSFNAVYNGAESSRQSIAWAAEVESDMNTYFVTGGQDIQTSTSTVTPPTEPTTTIAPNILEPVTPELTTPEPGSAVTSVVSLLTLAFVAVANIVL